MAEEQASPQQVALFLVKQGVSVKARCCKAGICKSLSIRSCRLVCFAVVCVTLTSRLLSLPTPFLQGCVIEDSLLMGADYYEQYEECEAFTVRLRAHMCGVFGRVPLCPADKGEE